VHLRLKRERWGCSPDVQRLVETVFVELYRILIDISLRSTIISTDPTPFPPRARSRDSRGRAKIHLLVSEDVIRKHPSLHHSQLVPESRVAGGFFRPEPGVVVGNWRDILSRPWVPKLSWDEDL
jgi:hypothetical protein